MQTNGISRRPSLLRLFVDDSGKRKESPNLVLAGYLSTPERWAAFNKDWQSLLDNAGIDAFRMSQAWRLARPYRRRSSLERDHLIVQAVECIKRHVQMAFGISMPFDGFHSYLDVKDDHSHYLGRAYNAAFYSLLSSVYSYAHLYHADARLEIVFDEQGGEPTARILASMDEFRRIASNDFGDLVIPNPTFRSDSDTLPLQAADLLAWLLHRDAVNAKKGVDRSSLLENLILGEALSMQNKIDVWNRARFELASTDLANRIMKLTEDQG